MSNKAWDMLRSQFKPDGKGRFKTLQAMHVAKQLAEEKKWRAEEKKFEAEKKAKKKSKSS